MRRSIGDAAWAFLSFVNGGKSFESERYQGICHGARPHGKSPRGATTTAMEGATHEWSIEERKSGVNFDLDGLKSMLPDAVKALVPG